MILLSLGLNKPEDLFHVLSLELLSDNQCTIEGQIQGFIGGGGGGAWAHITSANPEVPYGPEVLVVFMLSRAT